MVLEKILEIPLDCKEIQPANPEYSLKGLMLKLQYFGHLMQTAWWKDPDAGKDWKQKEKRVTEDERVE